MISNLLKDSIIYYVGLHRLPFSSKPRHSLCLCLSLSLDLWMLPNWSLERRRNGQRMLCSWSSELRVKGQWMFPNWSSERRDNKQRSPSGSWIEWFFFLINDLWFSWWFCWLSFEGFSVYWSICLVWSSVFIILNSWIGFAGVPMS